MKNEQKKQDELHAKNLTEMKKLKEKAEEELGTAIKKNENIVNENKTLLKVFDNMNELMAIKGQEKMTFEASNERRSLGATAKYSCDKCDFVGQDSHDLSSHKENEHSSNHSCDKCKFVATSINALRNHLKEKHERIFSCD